MKIKLESYKGFMLREKETKSFLTNVYPTEKSAENANDGDEEYEVAQVVITVIN